MKNKILWGLQILVAVAFFAAASAKLAGVQQAVEIFDKIGVSPQFRHFAALWEITGAILLLIPGMSGFGALLLACAMADAIVAHLFVLGGSPIPAIVLLVITAYIAFQRIWVRRT